MGKPNGLRLAAVVWAACLAAAVAACEQPGNAAVMAVEGNVVPQALKVNGGLVCNYTAAQAFYGPAVVDLAQTTSLWYHAQIKNNLISTTAINGSNEQLLRNDHNTITLKQAKVTMLRKGTANKVFSPFDGHPSKFGPTGKVPAVATWTVPMTGLITPGQKINTGFWLIPHQDVPGTPIGLEFQARFNATGFANERYAYLETVQLQFTIEGETAARKSVVAGEVIYPVTFCWGCLLFPMSMDATNLTQPEEVWKTCPTAALGADFLPPCQPGNYEYTPCAHYCASCKINEFKKFGVKCDKKFCPDVQAP